MFEVFSDPTFWNSEQIFIEFEFCLYLWDRKCFMKYEYKNKRSFIVIRYIVKKVGSKILSSKTNHHLNSLFFIYSCRVYIGSFLKTPTCSSI